MKPFSPCNVHSCFTKTTRDVLSSCPSIVRKGLCREEDSLLRKYKERSQRVISLPSLRSLDKKHSLILAVLSHCFSLEFPSQLYIPVVSFNSVLLHWFICVLSSSCLVIAHSKADYNASHVSSQRLRRVSLRVTQNKRHNIIQTEWLQFLKSVTSKV